MYVHDDVPLVDTHLEQEIVTSDAGFVHENGWCPHLGGDPKNGLLNGELVGDVHGECLCPTDHIENLVDRRLIRVLIEVQDRDREAVVSQPLRDGGAIPSCCSGDNGDSIIRAHVNS